VSENSKGYGNKAGYMIFRWAIAIFGLRFAYAILVFVIAYYVLFRPSARRVASHYLRHRFPGIPAWKRWLFCYRYYYQFGLCLIDQAAMGILGIDSYRFDFVGADEVKALAREGRGIVLLTSHAGVWQQAISTLDFIDRDTYVNIRREYHSRTMGLDKFRRSGRELVVVSPDGFLGGLPELSTALLRGKLVAVMGDRVFGEGVGARAVFLGEEALFPLMPYQLSLTTGSDVIVLLTRRVGRRHFVFEASVKRIGDELRGMARGEARSALLQWYVGVLEAYVERYPFMWYNFFNIWEKKPTTARRPSRGHQNPIEGNDHQ
jgi:predicted LPLAT superfamily acyltransferase